MKANTMISVATARQLKQAGLAWTPAEHDFFAIPYNDLDEQVFVISDMSVLVEALGSEMTITFNGTMEWAMDHLVVAEAIWIPTEAQVRDQLEQRLVARGGEQPLITLTTTSDGYKCSIKLAGTTQDFESFGAAEAYAAALLHVLKLGSQPS